MRIYIYTHVYVTLAVRKRSPSMCTCIGAYRYCHMNRRCPGRPMRIEAPPVTIGVWASRCRGTTDRLPEKSAL